MSSSDSLGFAPSTEAVFQKRQVQNAVDSSADSMMFPSPHAQSGYTSNLEAYEISSYAVTASTRAFEPLCDTLETLKADTDIDFKSLTRSTNTCRATFYVEQSLSIAETEFDEIAAFASRANDAKTLALAVREKLNLIDTLTQRKISLVSRIDSYLQQAADLEGRLNVVQFSVDVNRSQPIHLNRST